MMDLHSKVHMYMYNSRSVDSCKNAPRMSQSAYKAAALILVLLLPTQLDS